MTMILITMMDKINNYKNIYNFDNNINNYNNDINN